MKQIGTNFEAIKVEILRRAKDAHACTNQYGRAYRSESLQDLCAVIKDNFGWCSANKIITVDLLMRYQEDFAANGIYVNVSVKSGYLLCGNASVEAYGNASVRAYGNASVRAYDNASVRAYDNASVRACDNASAEAYGNASVRACGNASVRACGNASAEAYGNASVKACDNASVRAYDNASVEAYGNAYCTSFAAIKCKLSEKAIYRVRSTNTVFYASDEVKFVKQQ